MSHTLKEWHEIIEHYNVKNTVKLENVVNGMKITNKNNFKCDFLRRGQSDQVQKQEPAERNDLKYLMAIVDDYSGMLMVYFLIRKMMLFELWKNS